MHYYKIYNYLIQSSNFPKKTSNKNQQKYLNNCFDSYLIDKEICRALNLIKQTEAMRKD